MEQNVITYDDFKKVQLIVGKVVDAKLHPDADKLLVLTVDIKEKTISLVAGIRSNYTPEQIIGKKVAVVKNLAPRPLRGVMSEGMVLAASDENGISVLTLDRDIPEGSVIK